RGVARRIYFDDFPMKTRDGAPIVLARSLRIERRHSLAPPKENPSMNALTSRIKRLKAQHPRLVALALGSAFLGVGVSAWAIATADADIQLVKKVEGTVMTASADTCRSRP